MKVTNVILVSLQGVIESPIVCNCDVRAGLIFADEARKMGVELDEDEVQKMSCNDMALSSVIEKVNEQLENTGNSIQWFEADVLKKLK